MLVSFAVENWKCFRDRQELSMETTGRVSDEYAFDTEAARYPRLNRVAAIYGPNASGKSCLVEALIFMKRFVIGSSKETQTGDTIKTVPFRFDIRTVGSPCRFEIAFIEGGVVYEYGFEVDSTRVHEEWLFVRPPGGRLQRWISRRLNPETGSTDWAFGPSLRGQRETWRRATRQDVLYVSTATQLNSESLRPIVEWFQKLTIVGAGGMPPKYTTKKLREAPDFATQLLAFLRRADLPYSDIRVREKDIDYNEISSYVPERILNPLREAVGEKYPIAEFGLPMAGGDTVEYLDLENQSDGTQRLYAFALPWLGLIDIGLVLVVDELDRSLHPHLVRFLIQFINRADHSPDRHPQLVATLHDTTMLQDALDRNQVWLTEKGPDQAAHLTAVAEFHPRKNESLRRGYLGGRYGALPNVAEPELAD